MGIAQFMPEAAAENGLDDPFDPLQAIPASARLCASFACNSAISASSPRPTMPARAASPNGSSAAASLPRETRDYVVRVTGLSVDAWRACRSTVTR